MRRIQKSVLVLMAVVLGIALAGAGTATAARFITSKDIKNGTIKAKDLSPGLRARLGAPGPQGPQGNPGPKGDQGPGGISLLTFADSSVNGGITLSGVNQVVTSTAQQLDQANGSIGGPLAIPAGPGKQVTHSVLRVKTQGSGAYTCTVQISVNGNAYFDLDDSESSSTSVLRLSIAQGAFLNNTPVSWNYRVVCNGAATRKVIDADLTVIGAVQPL